MTRENFDVCLFFYVKGKFLIHGCKLEQAESYGDFIVYPDSHWEIWDREYSDKIPDVDFDYFPRGRVAYDKREGKYLIYFDACLAEEIQDFVEQHYKGEAKLAQDEHYQCHKCNRGYVI